MYRAAAPGKQVRWEKMGMYDIDTSFSLYDYPEIKATKKGRDMYKLNIVPEDLSVYTWGSKDFPKMNIFNASNLEAPYKIDKIGSDSNKGTPICLSYISATSQQGYQVYDRNETSSTRSCIAYDSRSLDDISNIRFIKEYYYKEYVLLVKISATTSFASTVTNVFTLDEYFNNNISNYPVIRSVFVVPYYRNNSKNRKIVISFNQYNCKCKVYSI